MNCPNGSCTDDAKGGMLAMSPYNRMNRPKGRVKIFDTTLRDGEQAPGIAIGPSDKVRIAHALDDLKVDVIEAGFAASSEMDSEALRKICGMGLEAKVCSLARCVRSDVDAVADSGATMAHMFIATSDLHMRSKLRLTPEQVLERITDTVSYARDRGLEIQFSCEDATRSELGMLKKAYSTAVEAGATSINVPDTVGVINPSGMSYLIGEICSSVDVPVSVHCHNDLGLAVANTLAAVEAGATMCHVTVNGIGERAGNAALEEVAINLFADYGYEPVELSKIGEVSGTVQRITGFPMAYNKAIVGRNAFSHESGIHVQGIMQDSLTYEPFKPELVGVSRRIVIGKNSGAHAVRKRLEDIGMPFPEELMGVLMENIKSMAMGEKTIDDVELRAIAENILWENEIGPKSVVLESVAVFSGTNITATSTVTVIVDGEKRVVAKTGVGPVDAALKALSHAVNDNMTLEDYKLVSVTGGSDALCEATVVSKNVQNDGYMSFGKAVGPDVVRTSVEAMLMAINRDYARNRRQG